MSDLPWQAACVITLALFLIVCGVIGFIVGLVREEKARQRLLRRPDMSVGRDVYREMIK